MNEFHECFARCFEHVWPELRGADVFVDDIWSDVLHWNTAPAAVLGAQPACVLALMPDAAATPLPRTHPAPADERRAVFFVGSFLHTYKDACVRILKSRSEGRAPYRECVVYSAISNLGHARCMASVQRQFGTKDAYTWLQDTLVVAVECINVSAALFAKDIAFLPLPGFRPCICFPNDEPLLDTKSTDGGGLTNAFSDRLSSLLAAMDAAPCVWSIGISAQNLGQSLTLPPPTESSIQMPVIIIDRTLDIVPCIAPQGNASALEVITTTLPQSGSCDVHVPLDAVFGKRISDKSLFGSLAHPDDSASKFFLDPSLTRPFAHFASSIVGKMRQQFPKVITEPMKAVMSTDTINSALSRALAECGNNEKWVCDHPVLTDWACAVHRTVSTMNSAAIMYDTITAISKALIPLCASTTEDLTAQVVEILGKPFDTDDSSETVLLPVEVVLSLLAMIYSLLGRDAPSRLNKAQLEAFLLQFIIDSPALGIGDVSDAKAIIEPAFVLFDKLAQSRTMCRSLGPPLVSATTSSFCGVVELVLNSILTPGAGPLEALLSCDPSSAGHSTGMGGFLRKGFSAFGLAGSAAPPSIRSMLCQSGDDITLTGHIMFVFPGGISLPELLLIRERCAKHRGLHVHIVASALLTRPLVTHMLFPVVSKLLSSHKTVSS